MMIDSHCHLHDTAFFSLELREEVYTRSVEAGVGVIVVGTSEQDSLAAVEFAATHEQAWAVVGVHPHDTKSGWREVLPLLATKHEQIVGIGEVGLDYFYENSPREVQIRALEEQLQWASDYSLPVSFHVREAYDDFWPIFDNFTGIRGVLHSFTDTTHTMEQALTRGLYIGVNGISTFTKDEAQQQMFRQVPLERMLIETDAPFLTPRPFRGKVNEPAFVRLVAEYHAGIRKCDPSDVARATTINARNLFAI